MITLDNVVSIDYGAGQDTNFAGSQLIDPNGIVYCRPDPDSPSDQTLLYEEQLGGQLMAIWTISDTVSTISSNANTDAGFDCLVVSEIVEFQEVSYTAEDWAINPARIYSMRQNPTTNNCEVRLWSDNVQGMLPFVFNDTSSNISFNANGPVVQVQHGAVSAVDENPLPEVTDIYWATKFEERRIKSRGNGVPGLSTDDYVWISTSRSFKTVYTLDNSNSSS